MTLGQLSFMPLSTWSWTVVIYPTRGQSLRIVQKLQLMWNVAGCLIMGTGCLETHSAYALLPVLCCPFLGVFQTFGHNLQIKNHQLWLGVINCHCQLLQLCVQKTWKERSRVFSNMCWGLEKSVRQAVFLTLSSACWKLKRPLCGQVSCSPEIHLIWVSRFLHTAYKWPKPPIIRAVVFSLWSETLRCVTNHHLLGCKTL